MAMKRTEKLEKRRDLIWACKNMKNQIEQMTKPNTIMWRLSSMESVLKEFEQSIQMENLGGASSYKHYKKFCDEKIAEMYT